MKQTWENRNIMSLHKFYTCFTIFEMTYTQKHCFKHNVKNLL